MIIAINSLLLIALLISHITHVAITQKRYKRERGILLGRINGGYNIAARDCVVDSKNTIPLTMDKT